MSSPVRTIVFGPTGDTGSSAALTASSLGAFVALAMRDPSKAIPSLSSSAETPDKFQRVKADLTDPASVKSAVQDSKATRAFIYLAFGSPDSMAGTITALKEGGIELVVFLSSFTVREPIGEIKPDNIIPYAHGQAELQLEKIFGRENFVALRPGSFAKNCMQYAGPIKEGKLGLTGQGHSFRVDNIDPLDIGRVAGTVLAKGVPEDGNRAIYLYGPERMTANEQVHALAKAMGREVEVSDATPEEEERRILATGMPPALASYMAEAMAKWDKEAKAGRQKGDWIFGIEVDAKDQGNVVKYGGGKAHTLQDWLERNKALLA